MNFWCERANICVVVSAETKLIVASNQIIPWFINDTQRIEIDH